MIWKPALTSAVLSLAACSCQERLNPAPLNYPGFADGCVEAGQPFDVAELYSGDAGQGFDATARSIVPLRDDQVQVNLDPYGVAPLSAIVTVRGVRPDCVRKVSVTVSGLDGEDLETSLAYDQTYAERYECPELRVNDQGAVQVPVLGLYPAHVNQVRISVIEDGAVHTSTISITTTPLPTWMPSVRIVVVDPSSMEPGWNLASYSAGENGFKARPFVYDHHGRIRWLFMAEKAISPGFITPMTPLRNGNFLLAFDNTVYEYSLVGREVQRWLLPDGFQQDHDVAEMPDGSLLVSAKNRAAIIHNSDGTALGHSDQVIEIDRVSGQVRNIWDLRQFLDVDRYTFMKTGEGQDWFHLNSVFYDPSDDSIIVSGKHQGVAKIGRGGTNIDDPYAGKQLRWILAPHSGWGNAGFDGTGMELSPYLLKAVDDSNSPLPDAVQQGTLSSAAFGWPYGQHAAIRLTDGTIYLFDNGERRDLQNYKGQPFSRGVVYRISPHPDGVGGSVRQVWDYGRERGPELFAPVISNVDQGPITGNRFIMPGSYTTQPDGTPGGVAKMVEVRQVDRQVVFEAHITMRGLGAWGDDICYRQKRMELYPLYP